MFRRRAAPLTLKTEVPRAAVIRTWRTKDVDDESEIQEQQLNLRRGTATMNMTYCANCKIVRLTWATQRRQFGRRTPGRRWVSRPRKSVSSRLPLPILQS
jgi:hypothetical protein